MVFNENEGIDGLRIGQVTDKEHNTGCTVVLAESGAVVILNGDRVCMFGKITFLTGSASLNRWR